MFLLPFYSLNLGKADTTSYSIMINLYAELNDIDAALLKFEELIKKSDKQADLQKKGLNQKHGEAVPLLPPTEQTYITLIDMYWRLKKRKEAELLFEFMQTRIKPNISLTLKMLFHYCHTKRVLKATSIINDLFLDESINFNAQLYSRLIMDALYMKQTKLGNESIFFFPLSLISKIPLLFISYFFIFVRIS